MNNLNNNGQNVGEIVPFPGNYRPPLIIDEKSIEPATPVYDRMIADAEKLDKTSKFKSEFDYTTYKNLELRYKDRPINGGVVMKTVFRLANSHGTCQQCLYSFEIDTYGRGCIHDCAYCYAKAELTVHGMWNNPIPVPVDLNEIRKQFYVAFETDRKGKWADLLRRRIPLRIGSMSDSFMWSDQKYKVTQELLRILKFYNYPYVVFTRSDLIATDDYISLLDPKLSSIQFSISSINDDLVKKMEPGAPSATRRLKALKKLGEAGFWTTVRVNPLFPIHPDGYFTDPDFKWDGVPPKFDYSSFDIIDAIADHGVPSVLTGFGRFSRLSLNAIERTTGFNLRQMYRRDGDEKSWRDFHFSDKEIRYYYDQLRQRSIKRGMEFSTCYIGNGETHFWKDQDLWSNKKDCCNIKDRVAAFKTDAREIPFETRLKFTNHKDTVSTSDRLHEPLGPTRKNTRKKTTVSIETPPL
ncbi:MAG: radical SAM protein [Bdellovibrionales bacterium]